MRGDRPRATGDRVVTIAIEVVTGAEDDARGGGRGARAAGGWCGGPRGGGGDGKGARGKGGRPPRARGRRGRPARSGGGRTTAISIDGESWERYGRSRDLGDEGLGERSARD